MIELDFSGSVVLVTGAGSGLGEQMTRSFLEAGASVAALDLDRAGLNRLRDGTDPSRLALLECDVSIEDDVRQAVNATKDHFGRIDIACNNAAISQPLVRLADLAADDFDRVMAVNTRGVFLCLKYELPIMVEQGGGVLLNTSSIGALCGFPLFSAYNAAKAAVIGLTRTVASEYGSKNIRANALCPGAFDSPMLRKGLSPEQIEYAIKDYAIKRVASVEEMASTALWLCSPYNSFMTGQAVVVDGGKTHLG